MFKSNGGFTLVELIVVIAILGLLAGIGIPAYSGYMAKAEEKISEYETAVDAAEASIESIYNEYINK